MPSDVELLAQLALVLGMLALVVWLKRYEPELARKGPTGAKKAAWLRKWFLNWHLRIGNPLLTILAPMALMVLISRFWIQVTPPEGSIWLVFLIMVVFQPLFEEIAYRGWLFGYFITKAEEASGKKTGDVVKGSSPPDRQAGGGASPPDRQTGRKGILALFSGVFPQEQRGRGASLSGAAPLRKESRFLRRSANWKQTAWFAGGFVIQTLAFMFMHLHGYNVFLYVGGGVFGLLFYLSKRNIVPCTVAHMVTNLMVWATLLPA